MELKDAYPTLGEEDVEAAVLATALYESGLDLRSLGKAIEDGIAGATAQERLEKYFSNDGTYGACTEPAWQFHQGQQIGRVLIGANKSAKTVAGAVETVCWLGGWHPYRATPQPPVYGRVVTPALPGNLDELHVQRDTIRDWCPPGWLRGGSWHTAYSIGAYTLHFQNGSVLEFLSSEMLPEKHAGENRDFVWFDEELPRQIFTENMLRLARKGEDGPRLGCWWMTYVPLIGHVWMEEEIYRPGLMGGWVWEVDIEHNRHNLPAGFIEHQEATLSEADKQIRLRGKYGRRSGLVYPGFGAQHLADFEVA